MSGRFWLILNTSMLNPKYRNASEFAKNAIISQKLEVYVLTLGLMIFSLFIVTFPKYNPATAAAIRPDMPNEFATTTEPNITATERAVSENGSSSNLCNLCAAAEIASPTAMPPKNTSAKCSICSTMFTFMLPMTFCVSSVDPCAAAIAIIDENIITPVASLKLASDSIRVESNFGVLILLNTSITMAASVG